MEHWPIEAESIEHAILAAETYIRQNISFAATTMLTAGSKVPYHEELCCNTCHVTCLFMCQ